GIAGQDGSLLAELLLAEGYEVFGVVRRPTSEQFENLGAVRERIELVQADLLDELSLVDALKTCRPHEVYNLASPSFVPMSWKQPVVTAEFAAVGVTALLESIRLVDAEVRFYQASSSEIFGEPREVPQTEDTALAPVTPYGVAKAYGHLIVRSYRKRYGVYACSGILYNHESPRRPLDFVTRKVSHAAAAISLGLEGELWLGDLDARRDWSYAGAFVKAMAMVLRADEGAAGGLRTPWISARTPTPPMRRTLHGRLLRSSGSGTVPLQRSPGPSLTREGRPLPESIRTVAGRSPAVSASTSAPPRQLQ